jgi:uncharacterized membrane protein
MQAVSLGRITLALLFSGAGVLHFVLPAAYVKIMPSYLPDPWLLVYVTGVLEMLGGFGLLIPGTRRFSAWGLVILLVAVFPANITMAMDHSRFPMVPLWAALVRLPLQLPMIWWAWLYTRPSVPLSVQEEDNYARSQAVDSE